MFSILGINNLTNLFGFFALSLYKRGGLGNSEGSRILEANHRHQEGRRGVPHPDTQFVQEQRPQVQIGAEVRRDDG